MKLVSKFFLLPILLSDKSLAWFNHIFVFIVESDIVENDLEDLYFLCKMYVFSFFLQKLSTVQKQITYFFMIKITILFELLL